jgi:hypothetical protein
MTIQELEQQRLDRDFNHRIHLLQVLLNKKPATLRTMS